MTSWEFFLIVVGVAMVGLWGCWESRYLIKEGAEEYECGYCATRFTPYEGDIPACPKCGRTAETE